MNNHYQTLKVSRDAPLEVIRMAYKVLCQKYHPDKYPDNRAAAVQVMKALNAAYAVLSDPAKRKDYDEFLDEAEALNEELKHSSTGQQSQKPKAEPKQEARHNANESQANPQYKPYDSTRQPPPKPRQQPESHHPWRRMAARYIDMNFFAFVGAIGFALLSLGTENPVVNQLLYAVVAMASCILLEPVVLMLFGGTPGKALLNISVESKTYPSIQTVPFSELLKRTFQVYFFGLGLGLFLIIAPFFFMFKDYKLMKQTGFTRWDKACGTQVCFGEMGFIRFLAGSTLVLSFLTLNFVGKTLNRNERKEWYAAKYHSGEYSQTISTQTAKSANPKELTFDDLIPKPSITTQPATTRSSTLKPNAGSQQETAIDALLDQYDPDVAKPAPQQAKRDLFVDAPTDAQNIPKKPMPSNDTVRIWLIGRWVCQYTEGEYKGTAYPVVYRSDSTYSTSSPEQSDDRDRWELLPDGSLVETSSYIPSFVYKLDWLSANEFYASHMDNTKRCSRSER